MYKTKMMPEDQLENQKLPQNEIKRGYALVAGIASISTVVILIVMKTMAYAASGSAAVLASLVDSLMDAVVSLMNFMAIRYSLKPADDDHRYGHGKIEGLAALFQSAFIAGAGIFLVFEALRRLTRPEETEANMFVIGVMAVSVVLSALLIIVQKFSLRFAPSLAVEADQAHYSGDIVINGGVLAVLLLVQNGAPAWVDPVSALLVAAYLAYTAKTVAFKGIDMLLDRELPDAVRAQIADIINRHPDALGVHDLRTRRVGMDINIAFDLEIDPEKSLRDAHDIAHEIELKILELFPNAEVMIHKDPAGVLHTDSRHPNSGVHD